MPGDSANRLVSVEGKRAVVIGGTSGIGRAIALGFAADGADVIATSRSATRVAETTAEIQERGATTTSITTDVTSQDSVERLVNAAVETLDDVDILVNSAGAIARQSLLEVTEEQWDRVQSVQLAGVMQASREFAHEMQNGSIINISSLTAVCGVSGLTSYAAAKGGVEALTRSSARELAPDIRVNAIRPGFILTPQNADTYSQGSEKHARIKRRTPLERIGEPEDIVGAAIYLASDAAAYTCGTILTVDGGFERSAL